MAIRIIRDVPAGKVEGVERMFLDVGATSVGHAAEGDGEFTVTAVFPDIETHETLVERIGGSEDRHEWFAEPEDDAPGITGPEI